MNKTVVNSLGYNIKQTREGFSLLEGPVARQVGVTLDEYLNIENNIIIPSSEQLEKICKVIGVPIGTFRSYNSPLLPLKEESRNLLKEIHKQSINKCMTLRQLSAHAGYKQDALYNAKCPKYIEQAYYQNIVKHCVEAANVIPDVYIKVMAYQGDKKTSDKEMARLIDIGKGRYIAWKERRLVNCEMRGKIELFLSKVGIPLVKTIETRTEQSSALIVEATPQVSADTLVVSLPDLKYHIELAASINKFIYDHKKPINRLDFTLLKAMIGIEELISAASQIMYQ